MNIDYASLISADQKRRDHKQKSGKSDKSDIVFIHKAEKVCLVIELLTSHYLHRDIQCARTFHHKSIRPVADYEADFRLFLCGVRRVLFRMVEKVDYVLCVRSVAGGKDGYRDFFICFLHDVKLTFSFGNNKR